MESRLEVVILCFICFLFMAELRVAQNECSESRCGHHGPPIRFPFRLKHNQPQHCGYPGFDLSCTKNNETMLVLPQNSMNVFIHPQNSVKLFVKSIDYKSQVIRLHDPDNCLPKQLSRLKLSASSFQFAETIFYNFTIFNCSSSITRDYHRIPCLGGPGYQILATYSDDPIDELPLLSCTNIYNISSAPLEMLDGDILELNWSKPTCGYCEANGRKCRLMHNGTAHQIECFLPKPTKDKSIYKSVAVVVTLCSFLLVFVGVALYGVYTSDKVENENQAKIEKFLEDYKALKPTRYSYADIKIITDQFKDKLGQGAYGTVFKGKLSNDILVAVKILNNTKGNGEEFINEVGTMGRIHHINVVRLVGFCADGFRRALVYEFLPNESLEKFIFLGGGQKHSLGWEKLQDIALSIAKGIEYLHQGCDQRILHFDIKPHNILLDNNFNPKISDFGLAKLCSKDQSVVSMTVARETMGYIAPEVLSRNFGNVSHKSDVYSFGILLLEMVGGKRNIKETEGNRSEVYFPQWAYNHLDQGEELLIRIEKESDAKIVKNLTIVGLYCIQWHPVDRPSIKTVVQMLERGDNITMPPNPFPSAGPSRKNAIMYQELEVISESE